MGFFGGTFSNIAEEKKQLSSRNIRFCIIQYFHRPYKNPILAFILFFCDGRPMWFTKLSFMLHKIVTVCVPVDNYN